MDDLILDARKRGDCYALIASFLLTEPHADTLGDMIGGLETLLDAMGETYHPIGIGLSAKALAKQCAQTFYDVFFVPKSGRYVPPYASSLLDYDPARKQAFGLLSARTAAQVQAYYDRVGFDPHALAVFAPWRQVGAADNIGFEFAFLANLCQQQAREEGEAAKEYERLEARFLKEQLLPCLPNFTRALSRTDAALYAQVAQAALLWAQCDDEALSAINERSNRDVN